MGIYTYLIINLLTIAGPLALSFDKKVQFYKQFKYLFPGIISIASIFIIWDIYFTKWGIWGFNPMYITGIYIANLPIEEILFFITIPYACVFIYACIDAYFPDLNQIKLPLIFLKFIGFTFITISFFNVNQLYTLFTFFLTGSYLSFFLKKNQNYLTKSLVTYLISLIPFFFVNGWLTAIPVVWYNNNQNFGLRIGSIPVEDFIYSLLLILSNIHFFVTIKHRGCPKK